MQLVAAGQPTLSFRHCDAQGFATPMGLGPDEDHLFRVVAALNGDGGSAVSLQSINFPTYYLAPVTTAEPGRLGVVAQPAADDASWLVQPTTGGAVALVSLSRAFAGQVMTLASVQSGACAGYPPPSGNVQLAAPAAGGAANQSWVVVNSGPPSFTFPLARQQGLPRTTATQTMFSFLVGSGEAPDAVALNITFTTPVADVDAFRLQPVSFVTATAVSRDGRPHDVRVLFALGADLVTETPETPVLWARSAAADAVRIGAAVQTPFGTRGDQRRITWGYQWLGAPEAQATCVANLTDVVAAFAAGRPLPPDEAPVPRSAADGYVSLAALLDLGAVRASSTSSSFAAVTMDTGPAMLYYGTPLDPVWRRNGSVAMDQLLAAAIGSYAETMAACADFDALLAAQAVRAGGAQYADLVALAHRQVQGAVVVTEPPRTAPPACSDSLGAPLLGSRWAFMEEMSSDGDVSTVDVLYPASPAILYFSPALMWQLMAPVFDYGASCTPTAYGLAWAPHDLGTWPVADKTPQQQEQMPLEESGNMLILTAAVAQGLGGNVSFLRPHHWALLAQWAQFCNQSLPFPPAQLCTDDFEGPAPNNTNLAVKGIVALGAYSQLLELQRQPAAAAAWMATARRLAAEWRVQALSADGSHYRRQFNLGDATFSLKYNTLYDQILGLDLFPEDLVMAREFAYYLDVKGEPFGTPLDDRNDFTLVEYMGALLGVAGAMRSNSTWQALLTDRLWRFANTTQPRAPMTDWYQSRDASQVGFQARATVGDLFALLLLPKRTNERASERRT